MTDKLRELTLLALDSHGCERLKDFYECGPVQRAAVETFLEAALSQQDAQAVPQGYKMVPSIGMRLKSNHPITCLNPDEWFEVSEVRAEPDGDFSVRGENTCWFGISMLTAPTPPAQRVMLTDDEIDVLWAKQQAKPFKTHGEDRMDFARAVIEAYERKNGIK